MAEEDATPVLTRPEWGVGTDATCPACGSDATRAEVADDGQAPVGVCRGCCAVAEVQDSESDSGPS